MRKAIVLAPPNSMVLVMDRSVGQIPTRLPGRLVAATSSCVVVGTRAQPDGPTRITLGDTPVDGAGADPIFDGTIESSSFLIAVWSVLGQVLLEVPVTSERTRVLIWADHATEPEKLDILVLAAP